MNEERFGSFESILFKGAKLRHASTEIFSEIKEDSSSI